MNDERDPLLESLFSQAEHELVEDKFTLQVMDRVKKRRRNVLIGRFAIVALIIVLELLLSAPLQNAAGVITQALSTSLIEVESEWLTLVFAPPKQHCRPDRNVASGYAVSFPKDGALGGSRASTLFANWS